MKKLLTTIVAVLAVLAMAAGVLGFSAVQTKAAEDEVFELNVNFSHPEASAVVQVEMLDKIAELSGGRLKFNYFYSNSLVGPTEIPRSLEEGTIDVSSVPMLLFPDQLVYAGQIMALPLLGIESVDDATMFFGELMEKFPCIEEEIESFGMIPVAWYAMNGYQLHYTHPTDARVPDDFGGQKLLCDITMVARLMAEKGAAVTSAPSSEMYTDLEKGVGEGIFLNYTNIKNYGLSELVDQTIEFGPGGINYNVFLICFSKQVWEKLPEDLKELIMSVQDEWLAGEIERNVTQENDAREVLDAQEGYTRTLLTAEEVAAWEAAVAPMHEEYINDLAAQGYEEAPAIYDYIVEHFQGTAE